MTDPEIETAIRVRLAATPFAPLIVWGANSPGVYDAVAQAYVTPPPPFWLAYFIKTPPERFGLSKSSTSTIRLIVAVMVQEGTFEAEANIQSQRIIDRFPLDLVLMAGNGQVQVFAPSYKDDGAMDGTYFRSNVHVRFSAIYQRNP